MENPRSWGLVRLTIVDAIEEHEKTMKEHMVGASLYSTIYHALLEKGLVVTDVRDGLLKTTKDEILVVEDGKIVGAQG